MAKVSVYNMEGKQIDTIELSDAVFGVEVNEHLVHKDPFRGFRRRKKTLETEGDRSCKTGLHPRSSVDRRRRSIRTRSERLLLQTQQEREESGSEVCTDRQAG